LIRKVLAMGFSHLFGKVPKFRFKYTKLRIITAQEEENIKTNQQTRALMMFDRGIINTHEFAQMGEKEEWLNISTEAAQGKITDPISPDSGEDLKSPETKKIQEKPWFERRKKPR